jgi:cytochrome P450
LLSRFLEDAAKKNESEEKEEARTSGTDKELRDIVLNFMIAGRDTTACALSWTMYELTKSPEVQEKVRKEFSSIFTSDAEITYDNVNKLNYCHAVVLEVLRLHPSVPKDVKYAVKADTWPDGTKIPAGATVIYCPYAMGRDKRIWKDPLSFKPERFLTLHEENGTIASINEPSVYTYPVFNAGPRLCLGKPLALMEVKLIIGMLLTNFKVELDGNHEGTYGSTIVLPMQPGLKIKLTPQKS